jgi:hypothetical protein
LVDLQLFALVSVFPQFFLAFMSSDLLKLTFSSAGHLTLLGFGIKSSSSREYDYAAGEKKGQEY